MSYIHEAFDATRTICGLAMHPMMQTTVRWTGELPTCPRCRCLRGLSHDPLETNKEPCR